MKITLKQKQSNSGTIHDIESDTHERTIVGRGKYAVVLASYYGGKGYTTHTTEVSALKQSNKVKDYSHEIIDESGEKMAVMGDKLVRM